jgi:Domain of unknown function (DUF4383)
MATRHAATAPSRRRPGPAQAYCALAGLVLLVAGIAGFFVEPSFSEAGTRDELIVFDVNGWHNLVHVATGLLLLAAAPSATGARVVAVAFGVVYGAVAVIGLIDGSDILGLLPTNTADNVLHIALAALGILAGLAPAPEGADGGPHDREPPARERYDAAADASSPNQVFVGLRGAKS